MIKVINEMPEELQARFKALMVLYQQTEGIDEEEEKECRALELKYEQKYREIYDERSKVLNGLCDLDEAHLTKFTELKEGLQDDAYEALEVPICDVKDIQNMPQGVPGFWLRAMIANNHVNHLITEKDRPILQYLQDVKLDLHESDQGFTLTFVFEPNSYFAGTELKKSYIMSRANVIEKCQGCAIEWTPGSDPTKEKKKKKVKKGGKKTNVTVMVKTDSFFNFFETIEMTEEQQKAADEKKKEAGSDDEEDEGDDLAEQMDNDYDIGTSFKDEIVPLALEYYLGVIEQESDDEPDEDDDDSDDEKEAKPKKSKGGKGKGPGGDKPQECKQQ